MGICASSIASSEIHETPDFIDNAIFLEETFSPYDGVRQGSVYSKAGSKGLNQDAAILYQGFGMEEGALCGVFDGHGSNGHIISKIVRDRLPSLLLDQKKAFAKTKASAIYDESNDESGPSKNFRTWKDACVSAFKVMDKEIKLQESLESSCSGTTAVVVIRQGDELIIANLGDSRAVLGTIKENGITAVQLTNDLKPNVPSEADRIRKCNGRVFALKEEPHIERVWMPQEDMPGLAMSRAFGDYLLKKHGVVAIPEVSYHRISSTDQFVVLATDGIWDVLDNNEVVSIVQSAENEEEASKALVEAANSTWKEKFPSAKIDDCTVVCLYLHKRK